MIKHFHISRPVKQLLTTPSHWKRLLFSLLSDDTLAILCDFRCPEGLFLQLALLLESVHDVTASLFLSITITQWLLKAVIECCSVYSTQRLTVTPLTPYKSSSFLQCWESHTGAYIASAPALTLTFKELDGLIVCVFTLSRAFLIFTGNMRNHFLGGAFLVASETMVVFWPCSRGGWITGPGFHFMRKCC